jgi:aspartate aminotransferase-like enzyme
MINEPMKQSTKKSYERFNPPKRLLLGPGPSPVDDRVLAAMAAPVLGISTRFFCNAWTTCKALLRYVFETENRVTIPISATGSAGMEAALVNVIEPAMTWWSASTASLASACETSLNARALNPSWSKQRGAKRLMSTK